MFRSRNYRAKGESSEELAALLADKVSPVWSSSAHNKEELADAATALYLGAVQLESEDLIILTDGLVQSLDPSWYRGHPTKMMAQIEAKFLQTIMEMRKAFRVNRRPDLEAALDSLGAAHLAVLESTPAGKAVIGYTKAVAVEMLGEETDPVPFEGWYLVGEDGSRWRYCDGKAWTDQYAPA
jgi:hypothetical protein